MYDITVEGNHNFLTQRMAQQRYIPHRGNRKGTPCYSTRACPIFVGNCFNQLDIGEYTSLEAMRSKVLYAIKEGQPGLRLQIEDNSEGDRTEDGTAVKGEWRSRSAREQLVNLFVCVLWCASCCVIVCIDLSVSGLVCPRITT